MIRQALLFLLLLFGELSTATTVHADRVYQLVDYPANQNGLNISGTITTSDDAPGDFILGADEILDWQWRVDGWHVPYTAGHRHDFHDFPTSVGVRITRGSIFLPVGTISSPELELLRRTDIFPRGWVGHSLKWKIEGADPATATSSARRVDGDAFGTFWSGPATIPTSSGWVIAVAVPEPSTIALLAITLMFVPRRRYKF